MATIDEIRELHDAFPFRPFEIRLADGRAIVIRHPESLARSPTGRRIAVVFPDGTFEVLEIAKVAGVKLRARATPRRKTG